MGSASGGRGGTFHFSTGGGPEGFAFSNPESIFAEFFRDDGDMFGGFRGVNGGMPSGFPGPSPGGDRRNSARFSANGAKQRASTPEVTVLEKPLLCSLEDLFNGTTKKMKIKRKTYDAAGKQIIEDRILQVPIKPGLKAGSKIKFTNVGDQIEGGTQDIHFVVTEVRSQQI